MSVRLAPVPPPTDYASFLSAHIGRICMTCATSMTYGIQTALFLAAISAVSRKEQRSRILFSALVTLHILATANLVSYMLGLYFAPPGRVGESTVTTQCEWTAYIATSTASNACIHLTFLLSDALVAWRAWVLWPDSRIARLVLLLCIMGSIAGALIDMGGQVFYAFFTAPVIVTNLAATALVGVKTWVYRRQIAVWLGPSSGDSRVGRVLMLLLESGLAFCGACITLTVVTFMDVRFGFIIFTFMRSFLQGFAGIYATLVILMVAAQEHLTSDPALAGQSSFLASIRFLSHDEEPED